MISQAWPAPAKLNLFLHITGQRDDGYHLLQTLFQFIDLMDHLDFTIREDGEIHRTSEMVGIAEADDLVVRAARALQDATMTHYGADIHVNKRIPARGGLGGGSSNAATTLVALNALWGIGLSQQQLATIGLELGADVPIFIYGHAAWAEGVGEHFTPAKPKESSYLVIYPGCSVPTASVFGANDLTRNTPPITIRDFLEKGGRNDCQPVVVRQYPAVAEAIDWLSQHATTLLTGTGACLFAPFSDRERTKNVCDLIPEDWEGFVVSGMNRSPLMERLKQPLI